MLTLRQLAEIPRGLVSNIIPFTYRDSLTYLEKLEAVTQRYNELLEAVITLSDTVMSLSAQIEDALEDINARYSDYSNATLINVNKRLELFDRELRAYVGTATVFGSALNPTTGKIEPINKVVNDVFDWSREFADFADTETITSEMHDTLNRTAYKLDITPSEELQERN